MKITVLAWLSAVLYLVAIGLVFNRRTSSRRMNAVGIVSVCAWLTHGFILYSLIDGGVGQNLSVVNLLSFACWLLLLLLLIARCCSSVASLFMLVLPLTLASLAAATLLPGAHGLSAAGLPHVTSHVVIAVLAFSLLAMAALQAFLLAVSSYCLKNHTGAAYLQFLPPLETMESLLFRFIGLGFIVLTIVMISSFIWFHQAIVGIYLAKTILTVASWCVFAALLWARYYYRWRGLNVIKYTLVGLLILLICMLCLTWITTS